MKQPDSGIHCKRMEPAPSKAVYDLYRGAIEWDLIDPILIRDRDDLKSERNWRSRFEPYRHQVDNLISFCRRLPVTLLADDVGLGKTISAGLVMSELMTRGRITKTLVVCPKLLMPQWQEELKTKFDIPSTIAIGKELLETEPPKEGGAVITTYQSARLYLDELKDIGYDMLVLDEAHKLRNLFGVEQPPQVAVRFREALADRRFKYVLMLTATPIQNRLWDLYSLVDLLTTARGHENPFGSQGMFARDYIFDSPPQARRLNPAKQDDFRSIIYSYMSRVRRADANLHFPDRIVQLHKVQPSNEEIRLIELIAEPIQRLNRLAQISILQALVSSPHALKSQLRNMAANGSIPHALYSAVAELVDRMRSTAKMAGLSTLLDKLEREQSRTWRMVIFTTRRETQTSIESFISARKISYGLINGDSGKRNQETIARFTKDPPDIHVIVSTEAGSEGINLQAANVLVNYDLPWNPMIVEQRIGRIQRLASVHANVCIFNIVLSGTFEEYIVGRLMEKLQLAAHAIGDIEALLEATGMNGADDEGPDTFEEEIRKLVIASLAGKNVEHATLLAVQSIQEAKEKLEQEESDINTLLGGSNQGASEVPYPDLPEATHSIAPDQFVKEAFGYLGGRITDLENGLFEVSLEGSDDLICFDEEIQKLHPSAVLYRPGTIPFERLANRIASEGFHLVVDVDKNPAEGATDIAQEWALGFGAASCTPGIVSIRRGFEGKILVRVRATVAHDSYERLVELNRVGEPQWVSQPEAAVSPIPRLIENTVNIGIDTDSVFQSVRLDHGIAEFCRFYVERLAQERDATKPESRKQKKLEDDLTPRLSLLIVGLEGKVSRRIDTEVSYRFDSGPSYQSTLAIVPSKGEIVNGPELKECCLTQRVVPVDCLASCAISGMAAIAHLLVKSELSGRCALPEYSLVSALSGKRILIDEAGKSAITGEYSEKTLLKTSPISGLSAEPKYFTRCELTGVEVLETETTMSQISGRRYRSDQQTRSAVSGRTGHQLEFIRCAETGQYITPDEAERCAVTGKLVAPGILQACEVSGLKVLPGELERSAVSGKMALKKYFVSSSLSGARMIETEAIRSAAGKYCSPSEGKLCMWSGEKIHSDDVRICHLTGIQVHARYVASSYRGALDTLAGLLEGSLRNADRSELWQMIIASLARVVEGRCTIEASVASPDGDKLAVSVVSKEWMGLKSRVLGFVYSISKSAVVGRIVKGKRDDNGWELTKK